MVVGVHGANGAHALKRVALGHSTAVGPVPIQVLHMEGTIALDNKKRRESATPILVQLTAAGHYGEGGPPVLRRVGLEARLAREPVPILFLNTEERSARVRVNKRSPVC